MPKKILVTGATGYVGGRLVPELLSQGHQIKVLARNADRLRDYSWVNDVEIIQGDAKDEDAVRKAVENVDVIYFLLHSIVLGNQLQSSEEEIANNFARCAQKAGVSRFIYLGGMVSDENSKLSKHLESRVNVGKILRSSGVATIELRAAVIIGSGSASFEMLRYLTENLPIMIAPKWLNTKVQPIAIRDVLSYLVASANTSKEINDHFDIAGPDVLTYKEMMKRYARVAGLRKRIIITVPILSPRLSSHWINLVTPVPRSIARPLAQSLVNEVVAKPVNLSSILEKDFDEPLNFETSVDLALQKVRNEDVLTRWSGALNSDDDHASKPSDPAPTDPMWSGGKLYVDKRTINTSANIKFLWQVVESIGGSNGWYSFPLAWQVRGFFDRLIGGAGIRRGRRDPKKLRIGESVDFWRVEEKTDEHLLRLKAEMKLPGQAWLELAMDNNSEPNSLNTVFQVRATFRPRGLAGHLYWWFVRPFHGIVFGSMLKNIPKKAIEIEKIKS